MSSKALPQGFLNLAVDQTARALEAVELIAGSYGKKELGEKARGLRERMEG